MNSRVMEISRESEEERERMFLEVKARDFSAEAEILKALGHPVRLQGQPHP